ncbi:radical SAM family heme chaperone HemW [Blautia sp. An46]|mgnify:FL=1|uniref:radical SAM family heme chaperone HemW n=1 Tax=Blautia sp. An46 TaxID=1965636 RepID=UPI000B368FD4|nr:radical SAM family heme chaperone HemW [Blautia sp. An46]OUN89003.1 coproporphyrinogen III oxidase [Blautia sp. An46]HJD38080.1 radical SAM family heme chaperone HemW [Candidatus Blautia ornithocaccae]
MKKDLGLYIHIPFCVKKCAYCDFLSWKGSDEEREAYVQALEKEISSYSEFAKDYRVSTVFFGGGTPSVLEGEQTERILKKIRDTFRVEKDAEITLEMNPGTAQKEKLLLYRELGINRLSIGLQSVKNENLKLLGRIHTYGDFLDSYRMAREAGFDNISADLISSLPGQTLEEWKEELEILQETPLEHISVYQLIIEKGTEFYEKYGEHEELLPDEETSREIYLWTGKYLKEHGFEQYEISNYARPSRKSRHNLRYWERKDYLGLGLGAASMVHNIRMSNTRDWEKYIEGSQNPKRLREEVEFLEEPRQMEEFMFLGLRKTEGVSRKEFRRTFGRELDMVYEKALEKHLENGMLEASKDRIRLSQAGILVSNQVLSDFIFD